eukprot:s68_g9.t1
MSARFRGGVSEDYLDGYGWWSGLGALVFPALLSLSPGQILRLHTSCRTMQFSCAAFFSVLLALPGRTVAVSSQKTADEASGGAGPWLSLLTSSWALAGEPQSEQTQGLDDLAQNLVKLAKDGAPPDESMKQAINSIRNIVNDMKKQVNETNAAAQYEINRKAEFVAACAVPETPALKLPSTQEDVVTCRSEEDPLYKAWQLCESEKARCSNTTACCASLVQPNKYCLNPGVAPSPLQYEAQCDGTSSCKETDIKEKIAFFKGKLDALDAAEKACEDSRAGCQDSYDCVPKEDSWKVKQTSCNEMQTKFEQGHCDHAEALEAAWDKYLTCYDTKKTALTSEELKQEATVPGRHQEWRALLRIDCLLGALEVDATRSAAGFGDFWVLGLGRVAKFQTKRCGDEGGDQDDEDHGEDEQYDAITPAAADDYADDADADADDDGGDNTILIGG